MTLVKSFSYLNINQRRLLLINLFLASLLASSILADIFYSAQYYFFYITSARYILLAVLPALVAGSLLGRFIFSVFKSYRLLFTLIDIFFFIICGLYICRFFIVNSGANPVFVLITSCGHGMLLYAALISFFAGIKLNYGLKISSGDFIDEKHGIYSFFTICFAGILSGIIIASIHITGFISADNIIIICLQSAAALVVLVSSFFINMEYNPDTMYMHRFDEDEQAAAVEHRDDIFFTYLNASYIFMYTYLAYFNYIKFYADLRWGGARFAAVCILFIMAGFFLGRLVRQSFWHIYSEMLFPVFFMLYVFLIYRFHEQVTPFQALSFIIPAALLFGFTVCQTVRMLVDRFEQESRYNVLFFSMFIIPPPLLIVLSFVEFTYFWYFILIYLLTLLNILIPGLYLLNKNTRTYKKGLYFGLTLVFIPILLFMHLYLKIPINSARYLPKVKNFNELKNTNFNALYLKNKSDIMINDTIAFRSSDSVVRGLKRAMLAALLYQQDDSTALILDGNQKFFRNPVISWFKNYELVDTVPARFVDYERLPLAGNQLYVADEKNIIDALRGEKKYGLIASSPNILDMRHNAFRFSSDYYKYVKEHLTDNGIFAEIINPDFCSKKTISRCVTNISSIYKNRVVYFFSDAAVILASDSGDFAFNAQLYNKLTEMFSRRDELSRMFYNEEHFFSNLIETETFLSYLGGAKDNADDSANDEPAAGNELDKLYAEKNNLVLSTLSNEMPAFNQAAAVRFARDNQALTFLKESELAEASERYIDEMEFLFKLRTLSQYMPRLNLYIKNILAYKKDYYYNAALGFEKKKDWETAGKLYQAILALDKDNFEANYRLGLLSLTVQDMDSSFRYLQYALSLRKDDPKALTQMGILLFSTGRAADALRYLTQALERNEYTAQVFFYLGLVYEELGRLQESKQSYERAAVADPNDETIKTRLQNLNVKIQAEIDKWKMNSPKNEFESERGETIQLPVDKTSYDMRLDDNSPAEEGSIIGN